jgi:formylmethanofuran dehydrogenase subunit C
VFIGRDDGLDQIEPSLAIDATGTAYLAFAVRETREIQVSLLVGGTAKWSAPARVSGDGEVASSPVIRIVSDRVVLGYATDAGTRLLDFALVPGTGVIRTNGIQEGPDVIDPLGREMTGAEGQSGEEAGTSTGTAWRGAQRGTPGGVEIRNAGRRTNEERQD